jgi:hypothetical protein
MDIGGRALPGASAEQLPRGLGKGKLNKCNFLISLNNLAHNLHLSLNHPVFARVFLLTAVIARQRSR